MKEYKFDVEKTKAEVVQWIRDFFEQNGPGCNAVIGISGGKDSSVVAGLCVEALGKDRVIGVLMPCGVQKDISASRKLVEHLGIKNVEVNVEAAVKGLTEAIENGKVTGMDPVEFTAQTKTNLPPRIRMSCLYAVSQSMNGRVANTCNLSEDWVGYSTRYGDAAGDFSPLAKLTVTEVKQIGHSLGLPFELVEKVPIDGLYSGKTDEENLGFTYDMLDHYIRYGEIDDEEKKAKIDRMHRINLFKLEMYPMFDPNIETI
ncbi:MAG: NAD(+) synthase [Firmicutes bacterium]|nr:NAD(+) synthase [Bacillota bacterium]